MIKNYFIIFLTILINECFGNYHGPFLLWGHNSLEHGNLPALEAMNERSLTSMYSEAKAIILFVRNGTSKLNKDNFPKFSTLISKNRWLYLPQEHLPAEPVDYNSNVEVITLVGPSSQQDIELGALYRDAVSIYGEGKVLGILSTQAEENHYIYKRDTNKNEKENKGEGEREREREREGEEDEGDELNKKDTEINENGKEGKNDETNEEENEAKIAADNLKIKDDNGKENNDEEKEKGEGKDDIEATNTATELIRKNMYMSKKIQNGYRAMLYTTNDLVYIVDKNTTYNFSEYTGVTANYVKENISMDISFLDDYKEKFTVRIGFKVNQGYWNFVDVEIIDSQNTATVLEFKSNPIFVPLNFSYHCEKTKLIFRQKNGSSEFIISNFQIEPKVYNSTKFNRPYDCVDFTTVPIWSGVFVTSLLIGVIFIGLLALMDIKTPNRFENSRNKQLTFTVQE